jgi:Peptidase inhibitor I9
LWSSLRLAIVNGVANMQLNFSEEIDKYYDQLSRISVNLRLQGYDFTVIALAAVIVFSTALLLQSILFREGVEAQNNLFSGTSNGTSRNQSMPGEAKVGTYIVTLTNQSSSDDLDDIMKSVEQKGANVSHVYSHSINGFSVQIPTDKKTEVVNSLVTDLRVSSVEPDQTMTLSPPLK